MTTEEFARTLAEVPDPRFAALRGEHDYHFNHLYNKNECRHCGALTAIRPYCLRYDLEAWMDVAAACGWQFVNFSLRGDGRCMCELFTMRISSLDDGPTGEANNPRDALANAIREWWES